jgi:Uncharacterized protein conserved in bacteria
MAENLNFDWDRGNMGHIALHGITASEVEEVFANDPADIGFETVEGEGRWTVIGHTDTPRFLVVVWTMRGENVRPITAFEAGRRLRDAYIAARGL